MGLGVERVEQERKGAMAEQADAGLVASTDGLKLLEDEREVGDDDVGAEGAGGLGAIDEALGSVVRGAAQAIQLVGGGEGPRKAHGQGASSRVEGTAHEV